MAQTEPAPNVTSQIWSGNLIRFTTFIRFGLTRTTEADVYPSTQTLPAPIATPQGPEPTCTFPVTVFCAGSIRATVPLP